MGSTFSEEAIPKCLDRLEKAKEALFRSRNAHSAESFKNAFAEFLIWTGSVLHAIEAGSKETPQGRQWYGGVKRFGKGDELLRYMHQARNVEEHTKAHAALMDPGATVIGGPITPELDNGGDRRTLAINGSVLFDVQGPNPKFLPLIDDRYNLLFSVPTMHLGKKLSSQQPIDVGALYLSYLETLIDEAASLA